MPSGIFRLGTRDLTRGLIMAVFGALIAYFSNPTVDFAAIDWVYVGKTALTVALAYLGKNLLTDENGTVHLGVAKF